ncbi:MAG TPA: S8 family serine peptidase, partial [Flavisolibacter sp.]|nr:S8 family serine peptidase [Flavisolibacter sp.]
MKKDIRLALLFAFFILGALKSNAQPQRYLIKFKHKGTSPFSLATPANYLSARSIARRTRHDIVLDSTDLPVTPRFLDSIRSVPGVIVLNVSKWLNQVSIRTADPATAIAAINRFTFVLSATSIAARTERGARVRSSGKQEANIKAPASPQIINQTAADFYDYGASYNQVHIHNGEFLHNIGLRGQNMIVGMMDAGFKNYLTVKAFDSARTNGQIFGTYDFVANEVSVNEDDAHGMQCFSTIAANIPGQFVGTAPKAGFYLYRTEESGTEYPIEEFNWVCGAERIDSAGGDLISSSVGYYDFDAPFNTPVYNHTYADMNGNTTTVAIGADLAAKKGILVVNSAGNEGNDPWRYIITPADGDSVLAVGAVNTSGIAANFSSYGPSSDGQVKPDVASVGVSTVVQFSGNTVGTSNGTSFSAPNMAGLATCLWQGFPEYNNMKIINALRQSGSIFTAPND